MVFQGPYAEGASLPGREAEPIAYCAECQKKESRGCGSSAVGVSEAVQRTEDSLAGAVLTSDGSRISDLLQ